MKQAPCFAPERWVWTTLEKLGAVSGGVTKNAGRANQPHRLPYLRVANVYANRLDLNEIAFIDASEVDLKRTLLQKGDLLVVEGNGSIDQIGRVALWSGAIDPCIHQNHIIKVRFAIPNVGRFMLYWLLSPDGRREVVRVASSTSGLHTLSLSKVGSLPVCLAPLDEQRRITAAVDSHVTRLDETTTLLERVQRNLKRYRASVLKAAVEGRLVPTEADLARAEQRTYEPASVLLQRILVERRHRWERERRRGKYVEPEPPETSNLPELPEGWCWATVDQLSTETRYGSSAKCLDNIDDGVPVLRMGNIVDGQVRTDSLKYLPSDHDEFPDLLLQPGDLLFNRTNSAELVGKSAVYRGSDHAVSFASYLIRVRLAHDGLSDYVAAYINSPNGRRWIADVAVQQVGQANVNGTKLRACAIPLPPLAEQRRIVEEMDRLFSNLKAGLEVVDRNAKRCARLRQSILKWAFEGKLVDQDPNDEPASALLARIRAAQSPPSPKKVRRGA